MPRERTPTSKRDWLREDEPIPGQSFACISYIAPEQMLKQYDVYCFEQFLKRWNFNKSIETFVQFLNFASYKYKISVDDLHTDFKEFVESERTKLQETDVTEDFKTFMIDNREKIDVEFDVAHDFQTRTRGLKIRGVFPSYEEAKSHASELHENDQSVSVHVTEVSKWIALDTDKSKSLKYKETELNTLMEEKEKSDIKAKAIFDKRVQDARTNAIAENIKNAEKSGNVLTQTLDEQGRLTGVGNITQEAALEMQFGAGTKSATVDDIQKELFEGDDIITSLTDHGQSLLKTGPLATKKTVPVLSSTKEDSDEDVL